MLIATHKPNADSYEPIAERVHASPIIGHGSHSRAHSASRTHHWTDPSQQQRERIMQQLELDGDFTAEAIEAVRRAVV